MLIKITESCSMGCTHCLNDAKPCGKDMSMDTLNDVLHFVEKEDLFRFLIITGGEPTEHKNFEQVLENTIKYLNKIQGLKFLTIATNGEWVIKHPKETKDFISMGSKYTKIMFQVSTDKRYYPRKIDTTKRILREPGVVLVEDCVQSMTEMGRAKINGFKGDKLCSSCFNIRATSKQLEESSFNSIVSVMEGMNKICTPVIRVDGGISVGESDLCPVVSSIYKSDSEIAEDIKNCKCRGCWDINKNLPVSLRRFVE